jgi:hypothetical protein
MSCNFATHASCSLVLRTYKYSELQMFDAIQKLSCKANCNIPFFHSGITHGLTLNICKYFYINLQTLYNQHSYAPNHV